MAVAMQSVMCNSNKEQKYCFYILNTGLTKKNQDTLQQMTGIFPNFSIEFIDVTNYIKEYNFFVGTHHAGITVETWFRVFIPEICSRIGIEKIIYLDADIICLTDISELFNINIESSCLAAVCDIMGIGGYYSRNRKLPKKKTKTIVNGKTIVKNINSYFNAGILLFNVKNILKNISTKAILEFAASKDWASHDQDVLNILFEDSTVLLPVCWNYTEEENIERFAPENIQKDYYAAKDNPKIIHFCKNKPWKLFYYAANFQYFWYYALQTPFYSTILQRMKDDGLITSTTCSQQLIDAAKNNNGPGLKSLIKSAIFKFMVAKLHFKIK
jgi:lipopolysaccharide biosynthesis glycosyltransferase